MHSINSILLFQTDAQTPYWSDAVFYFYPQLSKEEYLKCDPCFRAKYITDRLACVYDEILPELERKVIEYNAHFQKYEGQINDALSDAFKLDTRILFNDLTGYVCMNPICPRFLILRKPITIEAWYKTRAETAGENCCRSPILRLKWRTAYGIIISINWDLWT